jgi:hypothetical protein
MGRKALSLLLMVATLFGQSFCCCTFRNLGAALGGQVSTDPCCCHTSGGCPDSSKDPGHECPCKKGKVVSANLASDATVPNISRLSWEGWARQFGVVAHLGRPSLVEVVQLKATYFRSTAFPRLDGVGILRAVNSLRC